VNYSYFSQDLYQPAQRNQIGWDKGGLVLPVQNHYDLNMAKNSSAMFGITKDLTS